ncbi:MAG: hypothetical protein GMKNLPBB_00258 [Myxococcota bacterium]|nr:hypothetical protein [Myxococcota bacterium]
MLAVTAIFGLAAAACDKSSSSPGKEEKDQTELPQVRIHPSNPDLLYTWVDSEGHFRDTQKPSDIPENRRSQVIVTDLTRKPSERRASRVVIVADLTATPTEAGYPYTTVSRYDKGWTQAKALTPPLPEIKDDGKNSVVLYSIPGCSVCVMAKKFLLNRGTSFMEKDIEADQNAEAEMMRLLRLNGLEFRGVPVITVGPEVLPGYDPNRLETLLRRQGK